jgi:hypothetical protein
MIALRQAPAKMQRVLKGCQKRTTILQQPEQKNAVKIFVDFYSIFGYNKNIDKVMFC